MPRPQRPRGSLAYDKPTLSLEALSDPEFIGDFPG